MAAFRWTQSNKDPPLHGIAIKHEEGTSSHGDKVVQMLKVVRYEIAEYKSRKCLLNEKLISNSINYAPTHIFSLLFP